MPAGLVTVNFKDAAGSTLTGRFYSSDGTTAGLLYPAPVLTDPTGSAIDALGFKSSAAWTGTGDADMISLLKAMATQSLSTSPVSVRGNLRKVDHTPTVDTSIYAAGDVLIAGAAVSSFFSAADVPAILQDMVVIDEDDYNGASASTMVFDVYFFDANKSLGTANSAPSISDADAGSIVGIVRVEATDWRDLGGVKVANVKNIGLQLHPVSGTSTIYMGAVLIAGTPTFGAATRLKFRFKLQD